MNRWSLLTVCAACALAGVAPQAAGADARGRIFFVRAEIEKGQPFALLPTVYSRAASGKGTRRRVATLPGVGGDEYLSPPVFSPAGRLAAYTAEPGGKRDGVLLVLDPASRHQRNLARVRGTSYTEPSWSPDGRRIAFTSRDRATGRYGVYTVGLRDARPRLLALDAANPRWSPDGTQIAFERRGVGIYTVSAAGGPPRTVALSSLDAGLDAWLVTNRIAYHAAGRHLTATPTGDDPVEVAVPRFGREVRWSPDGTRVAFNSENTVWVASADGSAARAIAHGKLVSQTGVGELTWSPDGTQIAFTAQSHSQPGRRDIYTVPASGGHRHAIARAQNYVTNANQTGLTDIGWQPDRS
jgi:Tol biopolymer transport system component